MARLRVRNQILQAISMFMLEKGKVLEKHDYDQCGNEVPIRSGMALNHFGSWSRLLQTMEGSLPDAWAELKKAEDSPPPPKPKPAPKTAPKPKPAPAVMSKDEK